MELQTPSDGMVVSGGSLYLATSVKVGTKILFTLGTLSGIDDMTAINKSKSVLEELVADNLGQDAVPFLEGAKLVTNLLNGPKALYDAKLD